jgi:hypothetical protein
MEIAIIVLCLSPMDYYSLTKMAYKKQAQRYGLAVYSV